MQGPLELLTAYRALEHTDDVTYILSDELRILRMNGAWGRFARANGGEQLVSDWRRGANVLAAIPESLKPFYLAVFAHARDSQERWEHDYQCSSPEIHRRYRMLVYPFGGPSSSRTLSSSRVLMTTRRTRRRSTTPSTASSRCVRIVAAFDGGALARRGTGRQHTSLRCHPTSATVCARPAVPTITGPSTIGRSVASTRSTPSACPTLGRAGRRR